MTFTRRDTRPFVYFDGLLPQVTNVKYFGMWLDRRLFCKEHFPKKKELKRIQDVL